MTPEDQRQNARARVNISCAFGPTEDTPRSASVTSLSEEGCFVKTKAAAMKGQRLYLKIWLPEWRWLPVTCEVLYHMERVGIGLRFASLTRDEAAAVRRAVEHALRPPERAAGPEEGEDEGRAGGS